MAERRLKIAFVVHVYSKHHGHSRYVAELAERFVRAHEVHVFTATVEAEAPPGVHFHHVPRWDWKALTTILTFILPATVLVRGRFDIIHAQGLCGLRQNVTTVHMCQGGWFDALRKVQGRLSLFQRLSRALVVPLEWLIYRESFSPQVIAISETNRAALKKYYGRSKNVEVIYHGVDLDQFHPAHREKWRGPVRGELGLGGDDLVALYVGDLKKGAAPALEAVARNPAVRLVLVSSSRPEAWRALADRLNLGERAIFCPETKSIHRYYAAADLFLFPTFHDAFGMVITEAMAAGLPVITSRSAGAAELIEPGREGLVVEEAWDVPQLAEALGRLAADPAARLAMGKAARQKVERYTWDRAAEETLRVYRRTLAGASG
jgi:glycosyltransferase involved in cell wall biosynthesis